jgi:hypothetical protein
MKPRVLARLFGASTAIALFLAFCSFQQPARSQAVIGPITQTFTSAGSAPLRACGLKGENSATFQATGAGPIDAQVSNDGVSWTPATISTLAGAAQAQPFTPTSGTIYQVTPLNADCIQILPDSTWSGQTVTVTFKASGAIAAIPPPGAISSLPPVQLVTPVPVTQSSVPWSDACLAVYPCGFPTPIPFPTLGVVPQAACAAAYPCGYPTPIPFPTLGVVPQAACAAAYPCGYPTPVPQPTVTPGGWIGRQLLKYGTGAAYVDPICDTMVKSASINSAVTTLLVTGVASQNIYICLAEWGSTGTNTANTIQFEWGQGATCATNTVTLFPAPISAGTTTGEWVTGWAGTFANPASSGGMPGPAAIPLIIPANATAYNFCGVTAGTTTLGTFVVWYAIH